MILVGEKLDPSLTADWGVQSQLEPLAKIIVKNYLARKRLWD